MDNALYEKPTIEEVNEGLGEDAEYLDWLDGLASECGEPDVAQVVCDFYCDVANEYEDRLDGLWRNIEAGLECEDSAESGPNVSESVAQPSTR
jgi:hypothetical protein